MAGTFTRVKPSGWAFGEILTSAQANSLDIDHANAVDINDLGVTGVTITRVACSVGTPLDYTNWTLSNGVWVTTTTTISALTWGFSAPQAATITGISVLLKGAAGHAALPATPPQASLFEINVNTGTQTIIGSATNDPSGTTGAYQAIHAIPITGATFVADSTIKRWIVQCSSEGGANAVAGALFYGIAIGFTINNLSHHEA